MVLLFKIIFLNGEKISCMIILIVFCKIGTNFLSMLQNREKWWTYLHEVEEYQTRREGVCQNLLQTNPQIS